MIRFDAWLLIKRNSPVNFKLQHAGAIKPYYQTIHKPSGCAPTKGRFVVHQRNEHNE